MLAGVVRVGWISHILPARWLFLARLVIFDDAKKAAQREFVGDALPVFFKHDAIHWPLGVGVYGVVD